MIKNHQREILSFGSSMGCYLSLAQVYLEVVSEVVHLNKKDNELSMKSYVFNGEFLSLCYSCYSYASMSYDYVYY